MCNVNLRSNVVFEKNAGLPQELDLFMVLLNFVGKIKNIDSDSVAQTAKTGKNFFGKVFPRTFLKLSDRKNRYNICKIDIE